MNTIRGRVTKIDDKTTLNQELDAGLDESGEPQCALVVYHRDGVKVVPLKEDVPMVVGRAHPADVVVPDLSLSRRHAQFTWAQDGIHVEDLGSTNGTKLHGERIQEGRLVPGDTVVLGSVTASINMASSDGQLRGLESNEAFHRRVEEEVTRGRSFRRSLSMIMVRAISLDEGHVSRWAPRVRADVRDVDRMTLYGQRSALVLLPEIGRDEAASIARKLVATDRLGEPPLVAGVASFPDRATAEELLDATRQAARKATLSSRVHVASEADDEAARRDRTVVIASDAMRQIYDLVRKVAGANIPVLILGETGTGKEVIATAIHNASQRRPQPIRSINCGAIPATLIESALFGHEKGAFTGAEKTTAGIFEQADGGTVFLDEIGELSPQAQAALLRVLETKRVMRVGGTEEIAVDVRVLAATHRDLEQMTQRGEFRLDLLYRLNTMQIEVPPLRDRPDEVVALAELFLAEANRASGTAVKGIEPEASQLLVAYRWPGNVRELRNVIERAVIVSRGDMITLEDLSERLRGALTARASSTDMPGPMIDPEIAFKDRIKDYETALILDALKRAEGNQTAAARMLKMPLRTLVHKLKLYGIKKLYE